MSKGSGRRLCQTGCDEEELRYRLATGKITFKQFEIRYKKLLREGKVTRSGKRINESRPENRN